MLDDLQSTSGSKKTFLTLTSLKQFKSVSLLQLQLLQLSADVNRSMQIWHYNLMIFLTLLMPAAAMDCSLLVVDVLYSSYHQSASSHELFLKILYCQIQ